MASVNFSTFHNVINAELRGNPTTYYGINPHSEEQLWNAPVASAQDLDDAVEAGLAAFQSWRLASLDERRTKLRHLAEALTSQKEEWTKLVSVETGQTLESAVDDVRLASEYLTVIPQIEYSSETAFEDDTVKVVTNYVPLGVVAGICPWNFPLFIAAGKLASAVYTGNVIILKPSPFTPYSILKLAELAQQFLPPGVVQSLGGDDTLGPLMTTHPGITKISFTGSGPTGKRILEAASRSLKRVTLELGGNDACIVCKDVDFDAIMPQIVEDAFIHSGQSCIATKRIYVHASIYDVFLAEITTAVAALTPGEGLLSPIQNIVQYEKVIGLYNDCVDKGYDFTLPKKPSRLTKERGEKGYLIPPTIVSNPPDDSRIVVEEQFGPIVPVLSWTSEAELLARVNDTDQGLGCTVWGNNDEETGRIASEVQAGSVWVNRGALPLPQVLFEGVKGSGMGGEGGKGGLRGYCAVKCVHVGKTTAR